MVKFIDKILWKINKLDIIGNGYAGLKLRLFFYSFFSKYDMKTIKSKYKSMYEKYAGEELCSVYSSVLSKLLNSDIEIVIVTKNKYAKDLLQNMNSIIAKRTDKIKLLTLNENKKTKFEELVEKYDKKACIIGNNLSDDIINSFKVGLPYIYIGDSSLVNFIINITNKLFKKNGIQLNNIKKILKIF